MLYGSQQNCTEMLPCDRSHQLGKGQSQCAGMSLLTRPSRPVYGSQPSVAAMPLQIRSHQLGEGQSSHAAMPCDDRPSRPVRKGHNLYANQAATVSPFPINLWEDHKAVAEMPL